jgi:predicted RNA-binding Zn ribbon-like protein
MSEVFPEPAWRAHPAPGPLLAVQEFVNSHAYSGRPDGLSDVSAAHGVTGLDPAQLAGPALARLRALRESLRAVLLAHGGHADMAGAAAGLRQCVAQQRLGLQVGEDGTVSATAAGTGAAGFAEQLLARVVRASADGTWVRLKACGNDECRVAYYDHTRSRTARYCTSARCANRARQRAFRARQAEAGQ